MSDTRQGTRLLTERTFLGAIERGGGLCHGAGLQSSKGTGSGAMVTEGVWVEGEEEGVLKQAVLLPSRQTLTLSTPVPRQSPAGTQKPSLLGLSLGAMSTSLGGAKRNAWMPFTSTSSTYARWIDLKKEGNRS